MKEKTKPAINKESAPVEEIALVEEIAPVEEQASVVEVSVSAGVLRCPFCHDSCAPLESVVCRDCLARHHIACWEEGGTCSACRSPHRLVSEAPKGLTDVEILKRIRRGESKAVEEELQAAGLSSTEALRKIAEVAFSFISDAAIPIPGWVRRLFWAQPALLGLLGAWSGGIAGVPSALLMYGVMIALALVVLRMRSRFGRRFNALFIQQSLFVALAIPISFLLTSWLRFTFGMGMSGLIWGGLMAAISALIAASMNSEGDSMPPRSS